MKPEAAGLGAGRRISELSTPLAEGALCLSRGLGPWENFGRCQGGDVASSWEGWAGAGSGRTRGCTFPESSRAGTVSRVGEAQPPSLAGLLGWGSVVRECCPAVSSEAIKAEAMHGTAQTPPHPSIEIRWGKGCQSS